MKEEDLVGIAGYMARLGGPGGKAVQTGDHEDVRTPEMSVIAR